MPGGGGSPLEMASGKKAEGWKGCGASGCLGVSSELIRAATLNAAHRDDGCDFCSGCESSWTSGEVSILVLRILYEGRSRSD